MYFQKVIVMWNFLLHKCPTGISICVPSGTTTDQWQGMCPKNSTGFGSNSNQNGLLQVTQCVTELQGDRQSACYGIGQIQDITMMLVRKKFIRHVVIALEVNLIVFNLSVLVINFDLIMPNEVILVY